MREWQALSSKDPERAAKLKSPVELLKNWDCISAVDSVPMTLFAEAYDRVQKMIAKRDLQNYPGIRALEATLADLEKTRGSWKVAWGEINRLQRIHGSQIDLQGHGAFRDDQPSLAIAERRGPWASCSIFTRCLNRARCAATGSLGIPSSGWSSWRRQPKAKTILQFGESGDSASPHWFDQAVLYAKKQFKPSWYTQSEVQAHSERRYHPGEHATPRRARDER